MSVHMWFAAVSWLLLTLGFLCRKRPRMHVPMVLTAIIGDLSFVVFLQLTRDALARAFEFQLSLFNQMHIGFSAVAMLLYFPVVFFGIKLLRGENNCRLLHRRLAVSAYVFRTLGFLFMFSMNRA